MKGSKTILKFFFTFLALDSNSRLQLPHAEKLTVFLAFECNFLKQFGAVLDSLYQIFHVRDRHIALLTNVVLVKVEGGLEFGSKGLQFILRKTEPVTHHVLREDGRLHSQGSVQIKFRNVNRLGDGVLRAYNAFSVLERSMHLLSDIGLRQMVARRRQVG